MGQGYAMALGREHCFSWPQLAASGLVGGVLRGAGSWIADQRIEQVKAGDRVLPRDLATGEMTTGRMKQTFARTVDHTVLLTLASGNRSRRPRTTRSTSRGAGSWRRGSWGSGRRS